MNSKQKLEELADERGELFLVDSGLVWYMFDLLSKKQQELVVQEAERCLQNY